MIKSISLATAAVLVLVGCGGGDGDTAKAATMADAKKLAQNLGSGTEVSSAFNKQGQSLQQSLKSRDVIEEECQSGSVNYIFDRTQFLGAGEFTSFDMTIEAVNCVEDGETTNGTMSFKMSDKMMLISFPTEFTFQDSEGISKILKGGSMKIEEKAPYEVMTINMTATDGKETYGGKDLVYYGKDNSDGSYEFFPKSGKEDIGTGVYFTVDASYDASLTPMVTSYDETLQAGGLFKYLDGKNHKIEIEATAENKITIRVDENGNGTFEDAEIETIDAE